jgi:hypothetical protein
MTNVIHAVCKPLPIRSASQRTRRSLDPTLRRITGTIIFLFSIQNSNSYSWTSQTFKLQGSHTGPTPVMPWGGSPAAGQTSTWPPPQPLAGYWPPPSPGRYWSPPPLAGYPGQSSSTPPPPSNQGYWPPLWAPLARGHAPP